MQKTFIHTNIPHIFALALALGIIGAGFFYSTTAQAVGKFCYSQSKPNECVSFDSDSDCDTLCSGAGGAYPDGVCATSCPSLDGGGPSGGGVELPNPIVSKTFGALVEKLAKVVTAVGIPLVALFLIYSGFLFVTAQGKEEQLKTAKTTFFWAIVGGAIVIGAYAIATAIVNFAIKL